MPAAELGRFRNNLKARHGEQAVAAAPAEETQKMTRNKMMHRS